MDRGFSSVHPFVCFTYYFLIIVFAMLLFHPVYLLLSLAAAIIYNILFDKGKTLLKSWRLYVIMGMAVLIANPLFSHRGSRVLFYFVDNPITLEAVTYGVIMALSLLTVLVTFVSFQHVVDHHKFMYLFSSFLPRTAFLIMMSIRFIPLLIIRLKQITIVRKTMGMDATRGTVKKRVSDGMQILHILITWSLEEALQTADSMKARGYGISKRSSYFEYRMGKRDWILLTIELLLAAVIITGWYLGYGTLKIYPALGVMSANLTYLMFYTAFGILLVIPIFEEGREILAWR